MEIRINALDADVFLSLYRSVGWEPPGRGQVEAALRGSAATFLALDGETPVGMARLLGDGGMSFYVKDLAVLPAWQAKGVGTRLLDALQAHVRGSIPPGWAVNLELISTPEAVPFYKKHGFEERPCAWDGPGMLKMLR